MTLGSHTAHYANIKRFFAEFNYAVAHGVLPDADTPLDGFLVQSHAQAAQDELQGLVDGFQQLLTPLRSGTTETPSASWLNRDTLTALLNRLETPVLGRIEGLRNEIAELRRQPDILGLGERIAAGQQTISEQQTGIAALELQIIDIERQIRAIESLYGGAAPPKPNAALRAVGQHFNHQAHTDVVNFNEHRRLEATERDLNRNHAERNRQLHRAQGEVADYEHRLGHNPHYQRLLLTEQVLAGYERFHARLVDMRDRLAELPTHERVAARVGEIEGEIAAQELLLQQHRNRMEQLATRRDQLQDQIEQQQVRQQELVLELSQIAQLRSANRPLTPQERELVAMEPEKLEAFDSVSRSRTTLQEQLGVSSYGGRFHSASVQGQHLEAQHQVRRSEEALEELRDDAAEQRRLGNGLAQQQLSTFRQALDLIGDFASTATAGQTHRDEILLDSLLRPVRQAGTLLGQFLSPQEALPTAGAKLAVAQKALQESDGLYQQDVALHREHYSPALNYGGSIATAGLTALFTATALSNPLTLIPAAITGLLTWYSVGKVQGKVDDNLAAGALEQAQSFAHIGELKERIVSENAHAARPAAPGL